MQASSKTAESKANGQKLADALSGTGPVFVTMELLYAKLCVLNFPLDDPYVKKEFKSREVTKAGRGRLLPMHFACDLQLYPVIAGHDKGYQFQQFRRFVMVATWLCERIGGAAADVVKKINFEQDTPIMTAKQLLRAV